MDPQNLTLVGKAKALIALGRIPFATEVPFWTLFGCLTSSQIYPNDYRSKGDGGPFRNLDWWAVVQCMLITWGTNISINYCNEYFDWDVDRPEMVASIKRDLKLKQQLKERKEEQEQHKGQENGHGSRSKPGAAPQQEEIEEEYSEKMMGSTTRLIHDGTFPPVVSLLLGILVQSLLFLLIYISRNYTLFPSSRPGNLSTPFRGLALQIGLLSTFFSQFYVAPPLRLHYNGLGELTSALLLSPVSFLFGLIGHYTATSGSVSWSDLWKNNQNGFYVDNQVWAMFASFYCFEQARIFIMHLSDIDKDRAEGKNTFCVKIGRNVASRLYLLFNAFCGVFTYIIFRQLKFGQGMVLRVGGEVLDGKKRQSVGTGWKTGAVVIGTYALPAVLIVAKSLFTALVKDKKATGFDKFILTLFPTFIPTLKPSDCAKVVSLKTLITPMVLSLVLTATVLAV